MMTLTSVGVIHLYWKTLMSLWQILLANILEIIQMETKLTLKLMTFPLKMETLIL